MAMLKLAWCSLLNRRLTALLTVFAIAISVTLLLGVEKIRTEARSSFASTISGTDLIVGARSGEIQLLLYSVFRIGNATNNISWDSYQKIASHRRVAWTIPISLGDSHRGFRVMGTTTDYFKHFRYGRKKPLELAKGEPFAGVYDAVLGAEVAEKLGYQVGQKIVIAHGLGSTSFAKHDDKPFTVTGILAATGTPVDRTVHVSLQGIEAIHVDWKAGVQIAGQRVSAEEAEKMDLQPKQITAFMVGLKSKLGTFHLQRAINQYRQEALLAVLPGVALQQLWDMMAPAEQALLTISGFVVVAGLIGMLTVVLSSLNERRREMAILRSVGARPWQIFLLLSGEAFLLTLLGILAGLLVLYGGLGLFGPWLEALTGLYIEMGAPSSSQLIILAAVLILGAVLGMIPGYQAYRQSLTDGMTIRI